MEVEKGFIEVDVVGKLDRGAMENEEDDALEGDSVIGSKVFRAWAEIGLELSFVAHYLIEVHKV
ncbi:hypothetical protein F2Q68_00007269 [Brassica cretica]|uniref:Uncharacterized protein n=1 Tax=Brassica cretica TaxID=69181 RepID=A0A8S9L489_BRACR|nr:hypothetical protein F2Q68_00007269 [Brassica cretica]